ncbi:unnamed protein product, partial [Ectocarpus sp. 12 AP-2014]
LFSPAAVSRQPRELTIETIFVPPGEDGAECHRKAKTLAGKTGHGHIQAKVILPPK